MYCIFFWCTWQCTYMTSVTRGETTAVTINSVAHAGTAIDSVRHTVSSVNGTTFSMSVSPDKSTLYVGGNFSFAGDTRSAAMIDASGDNVNGFITPGIKRNGYSNGVKGVFEDESGGYFVFGNFREFNNSAIHNYLVYIDSNGDLDTNWAPNLNGTVNAVAISNSLLYFCGDFTTVNQTSRNYVAAVTLPSSGAATLNAWYPSNIVSAPTRIVAIDVDNSNYSIFLSGHNIRTTGSNKSILHVDHVNGTDVNSTINSNSSGEITDMISYGSNVFVCGPFVSIAGQNINYVAKIENVSNPQSITVSAMNFNLINTCEPRALASDGVNLWVAGKKLIVNQSGQEEALLVRTVADGAIETTLPYFGAGSSIFSLEIVNDSLYIGGDFTTIELDGTSYSHLRCAKLTSITDPTEASLSSWGTQSSAKAAYSPGCTKSVTGINKVGSNVVISSFSSDALTGQVFPRANMAAFRTSTNTVVSDFAPDPNYIVYTILSENDNVWFGGDFTSVESLSVSPVTRNRCASYTTAGVMNNWNPSASQIDDCVYSIVKKPTYDYLLVGGKFTEGLYKYQSDPTISTPTYDTIAITSNKDVYHMSIYENKVYIAGDFILGSAYNAAAIDFNEDWSSHTVDTNFAPFTSTLGIIRSIWRRNHSTHGDYVYVSGYQITNNDYLSRYNPNNGSYDSSWTPITEGHVLVSAIGVDYIYASDNLYAYHLKAFDYIDGSSHNVLPPINDMYVRAITTGPDMEGLAYGGNKSPSTEGTMSMSFQHYVGAWISSVTTNTVNITVSESCPSMSLMIIYGQSVGAYTGVVTNLIIKTSLILTRGETKQFVFDSVAYAGLLVDSVRFAVSSVNGETECMAVSPDKSTVYVGGKFTLAGDCRSAAMVDSLGNNVEGFISPGIRKETYVTHVRGAYEYAGGYFMYGSFKEYANSSIHNYLVYVNSQGKLDINWAPQIDGMVTAVVASNSSLMFCGDFTTVNGVTRDRIAAVTLPETGSATLKSWYPQLKITTDPAGQTHIVNVSVPYRMVINGDYVYLAGNIIRNSFFDNGDGTYTKRLHHIVQITIDTGEFLSNDINVIQSTGLVNDMVVAGTNVIVCGLFTNICGTTKDRLASIKNANTANPEIDTTWIHTPSGPPKALAYDGTYLWVGGPKTLGGNVLALLIYNASTGALLGYPYVSFDNPDLGNASGIHSLEIMDNSLYVGGSFTSLSVLVNNNGWSTTDFIGHRLGCAKFSLIDDPLNAVVTNWGSQPTDKAPFSPGCSKPVERINRVGSYLIISTFDNSTEFTSSSPEVIPFTGQVSTRYSIAAFDIETRTLKGSFAPNVTNSNNDEEGRVDTIHADNDFVWFGGSFFNVEGYNSTPVSRTKIACYSSDGVLQNWAPSVNLSSAVNTIVKKEDVNYLLVGTNGDGIKKYASDPTSSSVTAQTITLDTSYNKVYHMSIYENKVYVAGLFKSNDAVNAIALDFSGDWSSPHTVDTNFEPFQTLSHMSGSIIDLGRCNSIWRRNHETYGDYVYIAGLQETDNHYLSRYDPSGTYDSTWTPNVPSRLHCMAIGIDFVYVINEMAIANDYFFKAFDYNNGTEHNVLPPAINGQLNFVTTGPDMEGMAYGGEVYAVTTGTMSLSFHHYIGAWISAINPPNVTVKTSTTAPSANVMIVLGSNSGDYTGVKENIVIPPMESGVGGDPYIRSIMQPSKLFKLNDMYQAYLLFKAATHMKCGIPIVYTISATTWCPKFNVEDSSKTPEVCAIVDSNPTYFRYLAISASYKKRPYVFRDCVIVDLEKGEICSKFQQETHHQIMTNTLETRPIITDIETFGDIIVEKPKKSKTKTFHHTQDSIVSTITLKSLNLKLLAGRVPNHPLFRTFVQFNNDKQLMNFRKHVLSGKSLADGLMWKSSNSHYLSKLAL